LLGDTLNTGLRARIAIGSFLVPHSVRRAAVKVNRRDAGALASAKVAA
jgi:hypothetical protein